MTYHSGTITTVQVIFKPYTRKTPFGSHRRWPSLARRAYKLPCDIVKALVPSKTIPFATYSEPMLGSSNGAVHSGEWVLVLNVITAALVPVDAEPLLGTKTMPVAYTTPG